MYRVKRPIATITYKHKQINQYQNFTSINYINYSNTMHRKNNKTRMRRWPTYMSARRLMCILYLVCCILSCICFFLTMLLFNASTKIRDGAGDVYHDIMGSSGLRRIIKPDIKTPRVDRVGGDINTVRTPGNTNVQLIRVNDTEELNPTKKTAIVNSTYDTTELNSTFRQDRCNSCFPHNFKYVIEANAICNSCTKNQTISLLILIFTAHSNWAARQAIRATWLEPSKNNTSHVRYAFLLGEVDSEEERSAVLKESETYGDIIKEDFMDAYANSTYKTIMGFKWASTFCACANFAMKTEDDVFVNVPNILDTIKNNAVQLQSAVAGGCDLEEKPIREVGNKWFASIQSYPRNAYPGCCSGTGYVTSMRVVTKVYQTSVDVPFFHLEDVYVALVVEQLGYTLLPIDGFLAIPEDESLEVDFCVFKGGELKTCHDLSPEMLLIVWNEQCTFRQDCCNSCFPHNFKYVIEANAICNACIRNQTISLLILISTVHSHWAARQAIRATWLDPSKNNTSHVRYAFLLGEVDSEEERSAVLKESETYGDIIKEDFVDTYPNLTYKTIMGFKWASTFCACAKFVMKTDDDMFVNVPNILDIVKNNAVQLQAAIAGHCNMEAKPIREVDNKWFTSIESYPRNSYPGCCSGTGYVTSMRVVTKVYQTSVDVPFFHLEDVYVALVVEQLGYTLLPIDGFIAIPEEESLEVDACVFKGGEMKTYHDLSPEMLLSIWNEQCS